MEENQELLLNQIIDLHGKVVYTYTTHHKIQNRLERINKGVKISQIILTAVSTVGFLATVITNQYLLAWIGGEYLLKNNPYKDTKIPVAQFTADGGYYFKILSDARKIVLDRKSTRLNSSHSSQSRMPSSA